MNAPNTTESEDSAEIERAVRHVGERAKAAAARLAQSTAEQRSRALVAAAAAIRAASSRLVEANQEDMAAAEKQSLTAALLDRLRLDAGRVEAMAAGVAAVASLPDPVGRTLSEVTRPNGLKIARVSVPLGVIGIIYESRPNVTADAGALCLRAGNAARRPADQCAGGARRADAHLAHTDDDALVHLVRLLHGTGGIGVGRVVRPAAGKGGSQGGGKGEA